MNQLNQGIFGKKILLKSNKKEFKLKKCNGAVR